MIGIGTDRIQLVKQLVKNVKDRYGYAWTVLQGLVKTDFRLRYQGSFLGIAWSVLKPLMMFCVMYVVFGKFLRMSVHPLIRWYFCLASALGSLLLNRRMSDFVQ